MKILKVIIQVIILYAFSMLGNLFKRFSIYRYPEASLGCFYY